MTDFLEGNHSYATYIYQINPAGEEILRPFLPAQWRYLFLLLPNCPTGEKTNQMPYLFSQFSHVFFHTGNHTQE